MADDRPDPDAVLARVEAEEPRAGRGALRIFFGYAAGVGKTYAMLQTAHRAAADGRDVVVGYVEPHDRPDTQALLAGLEQLPAATVVHRGVSLREFDVAAALARRPQILLVDELAHTNAPGGIHEKRWQDIADLLAAGMDVWTTLNVQHIESLNDVVGRITGVVVRETVPDHVFEAADEIELVDITPEELLERLESGKVYLPEQARHALERFFQRPNLSALRELSLREAARRVHSDVEAGRRQRAATAPWGATERLLACVGAGPTTPRVIRAAKRRSPADAAWLAVAVERLGARSNAADRARVTEHMRLAERLGAETVTLSGEDVAATVLGFARARNVTGILVGRSRRPRWRRLLFGGVVDDLLDRAGPIDVAVIHGDEPAAVPPAAAAVRTRLDARCVAAVASAVTAALVVAAGLESLTPGGGESTTVMVFLAAVAWSAFRHGAVAGGLASVLAVLCFDFFFVAPRLTLLVADVRALATFAVMLGIGLLIGSLASRLRAQAAEAGDRERRTRTLYELGRQLARSSGVAAAAAATVRQVAELYGGEAAVWVSGQDVPLLAAGTETFLARDAASLPAVQWVIGRDQFAGAGTDTLPGAAGLFVPVPGGERPLGVLAVRAADMPRLGDPEERRLLAACAAQLGLALERERPVRAAEVVPASGRAADHR